MRPATGLGSFLSSFLKVTFVALVFLGDPEGGDHLAGIFASS